jgi:hypothetical protein
MPFDRRGGKWKGKCRRRPTATRMCIASVTGPLTCHMIEVVAEIYQNVDWKSGASGFAGGLKDLNRSKRLEGLRRS